MLSTVLLILSLLLGAQASITPVSTTDSTLLTFGAAHTTQTYLLSTRDHRVTSLTIDAPTTSFRPILSSFESTHTALSQGVYNITLDLYFEGWVGNFDYAVIVDTVTPTGENKTFTHVASHAVYGMVLYDAATDKIVSGDESEGVQFSQYLMPGSEGVGLAVMAYAPDGVDMTPRFTARDTFSKGWTLLPEGAVRVQKGVVNIRPRDYTTGSAVVEIVCAGLEMGGEVYETAVMVSVSGMVTPPVVLERANGSFVEGSGLVDGVVRNGGNGVVLMLGGVQLAGVKVTEERYKFSGGVKAGLYEDVRIWNDGGEGVVKEGLVVEVVQVAEGEERATGRATSGRRGNVAVAVITAVVIGGVFVMVMVALVAYRRSQKLEQVFVDGRPEHIARDVYGRGSLRV